MNFRRRTKKLSGLPITFYVVALLFFVLLFSFNSVYYKFVPKPKPVVTETPKPTEEPKPDSLAKAEIYVPDVEVLPVDTAPAKKEIPAKKEEKKEIQKSEKTKTDNKKLAKKDEVKSEKTKENPKAETPEKSEKEKITKIGTERKLISYIPGTMGKAGKLPRHNCKTKGQLIMFFTVDKAGNVTSAGRSSGIKDGCNITAAVIWMKQYVKAKKSTTISQGTYTIVF